MFSRQATFVYGADSAGFTAEGSIRSSNWRSHYEILGLGRDASPPELRAAYKRLVLQHHPDRNLASDAQQQFIGIQKAYEVLSDPRKRRRYDTRLSQIQTRSRPGAAESMAAASSSSPHPHDGAGGVEDAADGDWTAASGPPEGSRGISLSTRDALEAVMSPLQNDIWVIHAHSNLEELFGDWMVQLPAEIQLGHVNVEANQELAGLFNLSSGVPVLILVHRGVQNAFVPSYQEIFFGLAQSVAEKALGIVEYGDHISLLHGAEAARAFTELHPGGCARLRIAFVVARPGEELVTALFTAMRLRDRAVVAQLQYHDLVHAHGLPSPSISSLPAAIVFDPLTRSSHMIHLGKQPDLDKVGIFVEELIDGSSTTTNGIVEGFLNGLPPMTSQMLHLPEFDMPSYIKHCGVNGKRCDWILFLAAPIEMEQQMDKFPDVAVAFAEACGFLRSAQRNLRAMCFWLRLSRAPEWEAVLLKDEAHRIEAKVVALHQGKSISKVATASSQDFGPDAKRLLKWFQGVISGRIDILPLSSVLPLPPRPLALNEKATGPTVIVRLMDYTSIVVSSVSAYSSSKADWFREVMSPPKSVIFWFSIVSAFFLASIVCACRRRGARKAVQPSEQDSLRSLQFVATIVLPRNLSGEVGFGFSSHPSGGLVITSVEDGGVLAAWNNAQDRACRRIRKGDIIMSAARCQGPRLLRIDAMPSAATHSANELRRFVTEDEVTVGIHLQRGRSEVQRLVGTVILEGLVLQDVAEFLVPGGGDVSVDGSLEVARVGPALAAWNRARCEEGACCTQRLEVGDRIVALNGHTDVRPHLGAPSPAILVTKWRSPSSISAARFEASIQRRGQEDPWGIQLRLRAEDSREVEVRQVVYGAIDRWNLEAQVCQPQNSSQAVSKNRATMSVLPGDRVVSVNGREACDGLAGIAEELTLLQAVLRFERWVEIVSSSQEEDPDDSMRDLVPERTPECPNVPHFSESSMASPSCMEGDNTVDCVTHDGDSSSSHDCGGRSLYAEGVEAEENDKAQSEPSIVGRMDLRRNEKSAVNSSLRCLPAPSCEVSRRDGLEMVEQHVEANRQKELVVWLISQVFSTCFLIACSISALAHAHEYRVFHARASGVSGAPSFVSQRDTGVMPPEFRLIQASIETSALFFFALRCRQMAGFAMLFDVGGCEMVVHLYTGAGFVHDGTFLMLMIQLFSWMLIASDPSCPSPFRQLLFRGLFMYLSGAGLTACSLRFMPDCLHSMGV